MTVEDAEQLHLRVHTELGEDRHQVVAYRARAEVELHSNGRHAFGVEEADDDLSLPAAELVELGVIRGSGKGVDVVDHTCGFELGSDAPKARLELGNPVARKLRDLLVVGACWRGAMSRLPRLLEGAATRTPFRPQGLQIQAFPKTLHGHL